MNRSNVTATEALRRLLAATKLIDYADCKDETVWQALGAAQGTAEGVLRDGRDKVQLADEVIAALEAIHEGCAVKSWTGWQNGNGEEVGDRLERAVHAYKAAPVLRDGEKQEPVAAETNLGMIEYIANELETCINMQQVSEEEWQYATHIDERTAQMVQELRGSAKGLRELIAELSFMPPELKFLADQVDKAVALHNERCTAPQPAAAPSGDVERDIDKALRALRVARAALNAADFAIKGREHTGFIHNAIAVIDAATKE